MLAVLLGATCTSGSVTSDPGCCLVVGILAKFLRQLRTRCSRSVVVRFLDLPEAKIFRDSGPPVATRPSGRDQELQSRPKLAIPKSPPPHGVDEGFGLRSQWANCTTRGCTEGGYGGQGRIDQPERPWLRPKWPRSRPEWARSRPKWARSRPEQPRPQPSQLQLWPRIQQPRNQTTGEFPSH
jgi:hypothetical protein